MAVAQRKIHEMPKGAQCRVCTDVFADEINQAIANGTGFRAIAAEYGISPASITRHRQNHMAIDLDDPSGPIVISLQDVLKIPLQMKERADLINMAITVLLRPLFEKPDKRLKRGPEYVEWQAIIRFMRLQQIDEQTILRMTGMLRDDQMNKADIIVTEHFTNVQRNLESRIKMLAAGDPDKATEAAMLLADMLSPDTAPQIASVESQRADFTYSDLGIEEYMNGDDDIVGIDIGS